MKMYNPPHPGEIIKGLWLDPMGVSITKAAKAMGISRKTLSKIMHHDSVVNKQGRVTPEMAIRLSLALGSSSAKVHFGAESWLGHQTAYDLPTGGFALPSRATTERIERCAIVCGSGDGMMWL